MLQQSWLFQKCSKNNFVSWRLQRSLLILLFLLIWLFTYNFVIYLTKFDQPEIPIKLWSLWTKVATPTKTWEFAKDRQRNTIFVVSGLDAGKRQNNKLRAGSIKKDHCATCLFYYVRECFHIHIKNSFLVSAF
jgi:hypothetical protein